MENFANNSLQSGTFPAVSFMVTLPIKHYRNNFNSYKALLFQKLNNYNLSYQVKQDITLPQTYQTLQ